MTDMSVQLTMYICKSNKILSVDFGPQLIYLWPNLLRKSFILHPSVMCIFHSRQIAKKGFKSLSALTFSLKIGLHAWHMLLEFVGVHVLQCIFMCVHRSVLHLHK